MSSRTMKCWKVLPVLVAMEMVWAVSAALGADGIIRPQEAMSSPGSSGLIIASVIDGSGLSTALVTGDAIPIPYPTESANWQNMYIAIMGSGVPWMEFDLGTPHRLTGFHLWNWNAPNNASRNIKNATVQVKLWGGTYTTVSITPSTSAQAPGASTYTGDDYTFDNPITARFVKFTVTNDYGATDTGIAEIRFVGTQDPAQTFIVKPIGAMASSQYSVRYASYAIDGSGLSSDLMTGDPAPFKYPTHDATGTNPNNEWLTDGSALPATLTIDLGAIYDLNGFHLWNYNGDVNSARSISNAVVSVSAGGTNFATVSLDSGYFVRSPAAATYCGEDYLFSQKPVRARLVRFVVNNNYSTSGDAMTGIAEIRFLGVGDPRQDVIVKPVAAQASSQWGLRGPLDTINGSGLSSDLLTGDPVPAPTLFPTHSSTGGNPNDEWISDGSAGPATITFDLGRAYNLYGFHLWNYNGTDSALGRSISNGVVSVSMTGPIGGGDYATVSLDQTRFEQSTASASYKGNNYTFAEPVRARFVRITANSTWWTEDNFKGMAEIRFITVKPSGTVLAIR